MTGRSAGGLFVLALLAGCTRLPPSSSPPVSSAVGETGDPAAFVEVLRKNPDLATCRSVLQQLNDLQTRTAAKPPEPLTAAQLKSLREKLHLDADELAEVQSTSYTPLDAHYLEQCLLFHDAARALELDKLPAPVRARAAFDWTMRQVRLAETTEEPAPVANVLRRGWGSDWERALVFLAVLDQLGIHGGLVSGPGAVGRQCLAAAIVDGSMLLFDPRLGVALPERPLTAEETLETACPLSAVAPRMRDLERTLRGRFPVKLSRPSESVTIQPNDRNAPQRLLRSFLPPEEGGADQSRRRQGRFELAVTPWPALPPVVQEIPPQIELGERLRQEFEQPFLEFLLRPAAPRDLVLRGRHADAVARLVAARDDLRNYRTLLQENPKLREAFDAWCNAARKGQEDLLVAQRQAAGNAPGGPAQLSQAQERMAVLWKQWPKARPVLMEAAAGPLHSKTTFELALAKHEQAEHLARTPTADLTPVQRGAWQSAAEWWTRYLDEAPTSPAAAAARMNLARALDAGGDRASAIAALEAAGNLPTADQAAVAQRLQQLKGR